MRVLMLSDFFPPVQGGMEHHVDGLSGELAARGHDVHVATLTPDPRPESAAVTAHTLRTGVRRLPHVDPARPFHPPLPDPLTVSSLRRLIADVKPDVLHGHNWVAVSALGPRRSLPLVYTAHDYGLVCELRTLVRPDGSNCSGPSAGKCFSCASQHLGRATAALMTPATPLGRRALRPDLVLAVSRSVADRIRPALRAETWVVPNFTPAHIAPEVPPGLPARFFLFAGDPGVHKGIFDLLDVWRHRPPDASLVVATTKPFDVDLPPNVTPMRLSRAQVGGALTQALAAVVPSRWQDPCPTIALEALSAGVPVVASDTGGLADMVRHDVDGLLVPPGGPEALGAALHRLADAPDDVARMATSARERAGDYSLTRVADKVVRGYEAVTGRGASLAS